MKTNYHTHHHLCNHATGNALEYINEAKKHGFDLLGFSDHAPSPIIKDGDVRMRMNEIQTYINDIKSAKRRAEIDFKVLIGFEVEYLHQQATFYTNLKAHADYFILGQHYLALKKDNKGLKSCFALQTKEDIRLYGEYIVEALNTGLFSIVAHPDLYLMGYKQFDQIAKDVAHAICQAAETNNVVLEFNANGLRKPKIQVNKQLIPPYPRQEFFDITKQYDISIIVGSDCHAPKQLNDEAVKQAKEIANKMQLNIIEEVSMKW
ncbi:MAG: histidinol-phosphatase [Candidatus Izimaplasma sp.]|nr:histidinol-phosphatase [Candidatus Izimaplasma bacterium]